MSKRIVDNGKLPPQPKEAIDAFWYRKFNITSFLFDQQLKFVDDANPFKVAVCSRRAGKTTACAAHLVHSAINNKDSNNIYITLSGISGKRIIWKEFKKIVKKFNLPAKFNESELSITFPNESTIFVIGASDSTEIEKVRGMAMKLVYIDECQSFREYIKDLIDDIIGPALIDYAGSLCLIGTPGPVPVGYFHSCATNPENGWSKHNWTFWDNPHIPITSGHTHQEALDRELKRRAMPITDPSIQREFFGQWALDKDSLLVKYNPEVNDFVNPTVLPGGMKYDYVLGVDVGFKDADALAVLAYSEFEPTTYLVEEVIATKQGITELVEQIQMLQKKYDISKIVMDMGGLGKKIGEEIVKRHLIPVEPADKTRKMENIELMNDALRTGKLKIRANSRFAQDSYLVEIDRDKSRPDRLVVASKYHSDIIDAVLYAFKCSPAYSYQAPTKKIQYGSREWAEQQSSSMWEAELEGAKAEVEFTKKMNGEYE